MYLFCVGFTEPVGLWINVLNKIWKTFVQYFSLFFSFFLFSSTRITCISYHLIAFHRWLGTLFIFLSVCVLNIFSHFVSVWIFFHCCVFKFADSFFCIMQSTLSVKWIWKFKILYFSVLGSSFAFPNFPSFSWSSSCVCLPYSFFPLQIL